MKSEKKVKNFFRTVEMWVFDGVGGIACGG